MSRILLPGAALALMLSCSGPLAPGKDSGSPEVYRAAVPGALPVPYAELQAEDGVTDGALSPATTYLNQPAAEASGRRYVSLAPGQSVGLMAPVAFDSVVVRYSFPDAPGGGGQDGTLTVQAGADPALSLPVTSRYSWEYGPPDWSNSTNTWNSSPSAGVPRHFWDESNLRLPGSQPAGTSLNLTNPAGSGVTVLVDLVDLELVPEAAARPTGSLSFADYHPAADGTADVTALFQQALNDAQGGVLYVPEGRYRIGAVTLGNVAVQGAGMWRTRFIGPASRFGFTGRTARLTDFAVFGETAFRNDSSDAGNGLKGNPGPGSVIERLWIEHKKCAYWAGNWGNPVGPSEFRITGCRFRNLMADAVNLCSGTTEAVVDNCQVRSSGDDGLAAWSPNLAGNPPGGHNTFAHNLVQLPWVASGISLYGAGPFRVVGNRVEDTLTTGSGIYVAAAFTAWPFQGTVEVRDNVLVRCGAHESDPGGTTGAIRILAAERALTSATLVFTDNTVVAPLESAVSVQGPYSVGSLTFTGLTVEALGSAVVADVRGNARGSAAFTGVSTPGVAAPAWRNSAGSSFTLTHP